MWKVQIDNKLYSKRLVVVGAQLVERSLSLLTSELRSSNPVIAKIIMDSLLSGIPGMAYKKLKRKIHEKPFLLKHVDGW